MTLSTATYIHTGGQHLIFASTVQSSTAPGNWVPIHPNIRNMSVVATITGSSAGVAVCGNVSIQLSNDGTNALNSTAGVIAFSSATAVSPSADGFEIDAHYNYIRAYMSSLSTMSSGSTCSVTVTPHLIK